jgi:putative ABC transport system substrate-binding protein
MLPGEGPRSVCGGAIMQIGSLRRREFIALVAAAWPLAARAQQATRVPTVALLTSSFAAQFHDNLGVVIEALRSLGYVEGQSIRYIARHTEGNADALPSHAAELVRLNVDVIVASTTTAIRAAQQATRTIPIVMTNTADPVRLGFVQNLARPGGNITGLSNQAADLGSKQLQLLKEIAPSAQRVAVLFNPRNPSRERWLNYREPAERLGLSLVPVPAESVVALDSALVELKRQPPDAIWVFGDPLFMNGRTRLAEWEKAARRPALYVFREHVQAGGLMSYGPSLPGAYRQVAAYVDKILKGAKPADLPVEQPTKFELVINLGTAKALGLTVPPTLLASADEVIE